MLKRDPSAKFLYRDVGLFNKKRLFRFYAGKLHTQTEWDEAQYRSILEQQKYAPVGLMKSNSSNKRWWMSRNNFYWEDEGYSATEIMALILEKLEQKKKRVEKAVILLSQRKAVSPQSKAVSTNGRQPIPDDVKMYVWQRDGGRCVKCRSQEKLEYDHIIPIALGGSNTARNIQLLCEKCNRLKGANLV